MHLLKALTELPLSLALTTLALASTAAGVTLQELTPANFKGSTANGLWFVEHYSPYCRHCREFAPTWEKLVEDCEKEIPSAHLAQVNCVTNGDLCDENGIEGYPTLLLYEDGKKLGQFKGARELDALKSFIKRHVKDKPVLEEESKPPINVDGKLLSINDAATFVSTLEKGPTFIKFFAPWCSHCKNLAPTWVQLADRLKNEVIVAEVDCDAQSSLCSSQRIQGFPTLVYFGNGVRSEYTGGRGLNQLKKFAELAAEGQMHVLGNDLQLQERVKEHDVLYLFLHSSSDVDALKAARKATGPLLGTPPAYSSHSQELFTRYSIPGSASWAVLVFKDHDMDKPSGHLYGYSETPFTSIGPWLMKHRLPSYLELSADSFQSVMNAPQEPLVVIAAATERTQRKVKARVEELAKEWRTKTNWSGEMNGKEVVFTWMDAERFKDWLKSMYGIKKHHDEDELGDVRVVIVNHKQLVYYDEDANGHKIKLTSTQKLFATLERATAGNLHYKHSQNMVERMARYLNHKMTGVEFYVTAHPYRTVMIIVGGIAIVFYLMLRWLGSDMPHDRDYNKTSRLD